MSGMFETWLGSLVAALQERERDANVVVVDWLPLAHQLYTDAVNNTQLVGKSIAGMLDWLQVTPIAGGRCHNAVAKGNGGVRSERRWLGCHRDPRAPGDGGSELQWRFAALLKWTSNLGALLPKGLSSS